MHVSVSVCMCIVHVGEYALAARRRGSARARLGVQRPKQLYRAAVGRGAAEDNFSALSKVHFYGRGAAEAN